VGLAAKEVCFESRDQPGIFLFKAFTSALEPTHPPIRRVPGAFYAKAKLLEHEADHVPESSSDVKNEGAVPVLPHTPSWCVQGELYLYFILLTVLHQSCKPKRLGPSYLVS
jgi:hypothetical protein